MSFLYRSTRNAQETATASEAILKGLAENGGLFVPDEIPELDVPFEELADMDYKGVAYEVMSRMLTDFTEEELKACIDGAYDSKFDTDLIAPVKYHHGAYILELFHGKTIAFKDMALSILPYLLTTAAKKNNIDKEIVILTATSGDTGKAALAGFADVPGTRIAVFYPKNGVSPIQEKQMVTEKERIHLSLVSQVTSMMHRQVLRKCSLTRNLLSILTRRDSSSHLLTQLISDVLFHRWFTMYMHTQDLSRLEQ